MNTLSTSQPTERVFQALANDPVNGLRKGDKVTVRPAPYYNEKDFVAIQREQEIFLRCYEKSCRTLNIIGRAVTVDSGNEQAAVPATLALEQAKCLVASLIGEGDAYGTSDVQNLIHTLANLDRKTARDWARQLTAHAQRVSSE